MYAELIRKNKKYGIKSLYGNKLITLAGMLFDEVALMPESFVNQATARCSVDGAKLWFNCNPDGPYHWFKLQYIDKLIEKNAVYLHFNMDDNYSLKDSVKDRYRRMYSGIFFKRYILGLWVLAEGIIYDMFDENVHVVEEVPAEFDYYLVAVDYGTGNPTTFGLYGIKGEQIYLIKEYWYDSRAVGKQKTDNQYADDFVNWIGDIKPKVVYIDPSAASFKLEIQRRGYHVKNAVNDVLEGIMFVSKMINLGRFFIAQCCVNTIREMLSYCWDTKAQQHGEDKPLKTNDHAMDRDRYLLYSHFFKRFKARSFKSDKV